MEPGAWQSYEGFRRYGFFSPHGSSPALARFAPQEREPMGTAGPLKLAEEILADGSGDPFFVLNRCFSNGNGKPAAAWQQE